ncbi:MAG: hypothetical protein ABI813_08720 [Bacteroidota bacterium]
MKKAVFGALFLLLFSRGVAQAPVPAADAARHIGQKTTVCDKVFGGRFLENANEQPTLINMGGAYPDNPFTVVIFANNRKKFSYKPEVFLVDKKVCITGAITEFHGKPQIVVTDTLQVVVQ